MRTRCRIVAVLALLALAGCKVIVLGDSNTCMGLRDRCAPGFWPSILQDRLDQASSLWFVENRGAAGMTAGPFYNPDGTEKTSRFTNLPNRGLFHLERLLREDDLAHTCRVVPFAALAPRLVIALGTNDIGLSPAWVVFDKIMELGKHALEAAPCVQVYYATIPPRFDANFHNEVDRLALNGTLRARVPPDRLIEFDTGFTHEDFSASDGIHLMPEGHAKRAAAALRVLFPGIER